LTLLSAIRKKKTIKRGLIVSLIVGSVLIGINQGPVLMEGKVPAIWQVMLTYLVPFLVSTISSALADVQNNSGDLS